jgi:hypothetical protein
VKNTKPSEVVEIKQRLRQLADDVVEGRVDTGRASVASQLLGTLLRAVEQERRVKETELLGERMDALEEKQARREHRNSLRGL